MLERVSNERLNRMEKDFRDSPITEAFTTRQSLRDIEREQETRETVGESGDYHDR